MTAQLRLKQLRHDLRPAPLPDQITRVRSERLSTAKPIGRKQLSKMRQAFAALELEDLVALREELGGNTDEKET